MTKVNLKRKKVKRLADILVEAGLLNATYGRMRCYTE